MEDLKHVMNSSCRSGKSQVVCICICRVSDPNFKRGQLIYLLDSPDSRYFCCASQHNADRYSSLSLEMSNKVP